MSIKIKAKTYLRLGLSSLKDVGLYRIGLKSKLHPVLRIKPIPQRDGDYFAATSRQLDEGISTNVWADRPWAFGQPAGKPNKMPPNWHANIFTGETLGNNTAAWYKQVTFSEKIGDIKTVWEASRFDWALSFAQCAVTGDASALARLNAWINDWKLSNPAYVGPNWMCGQEASFRVAHLAAASIILGHGSTLTPALESFLYNHLIRISPTIAYARGQDNNHATSEAMALFIGGTWLKTAGSSHTIRKAGEKYAKLGRDLMEERTAKLIFDDGGFSQYSFVYHRLMLDSLSLTELWRRILEEASFSERFYARARSAAQWLAHFTNPENGDVPNMGSNDGAWLLPVGSGEFRDFRPSCAMASSLFCEETFFGETQSACQLMTFFGLSLPSSIAPQASNEPVLFDQSSLVSLFAEQTRLVMRLPGCKFRPHHSDALHLDVWHNGKCLLQDAGTYSYANEGWDYFPSTAAHNSIEFDQRDQMPRLSRFLYGAWLERGEVSINKCGFSANYIDSWGAKHLRSVKMENPHRIIVEDHVEGYFETAILRWRLRDVPYTHSTSSQHTASVRQESLTLDITADIPLIEQCVSKHPTSLYFLRQQKIPVLEIKITHSGCIRTVININR